MAIAVNSIIEFSLNMDHLGSRLMNVYTYKVAVLPGAVSAVAYGEAWWNHVKTAYRALSQSAAGPVFTSVLVRDLSDSAGELAEYSIPTADRTGTRATTAAPEALPNLNAVGMRLTVGTRVTRPGQKRIPFLTEADIAGDAVSATYVGLVQTLGGVVSARAILGAPAAGVAIDPVIVSRDATGAVTADQVVIGYNVNPYVTSQVSRKRGRGA